MRDQRITTVMSQVAGLGRVRFTDSWGVSFATIGICAAGSSHATTSHVTLSRKAGR